MPLSYALQTPLALLMLDSGSWETRGHQPAASDETHREQDAAAA